MKGYQQLSFKGDAYGKTQQQSHPETLEILCISALVPRHEGGSRPSAEGAGHVDSSIPLVMSPCTPLPLPLS